MKIKFKEIKYFSPTGNNNLPNGVYIQKGLYITECTKNKHKFAENIGEDIVNQDSSKNKVMIILHNNYTNEDKLQECLQLQNAGYNINIGHFFYGKFMTNNDTKENITFDINSLAISINEKKISNIKKIVSDLLVFLEIESVLVRFNDYSSWKIMFVTCKS